MRRFMLCAVFCFLLLATPVAFPQSKASAKPAARFLNSPDLTPPPGYSHAAIVERGKLVFVAGQVGLNKEGQMVGANDFRAQAAQAFANLKATLATAGARPDNLVKLNYYVVGLNRERLMALRELRDQIVNQAHPPASTLIGVQALFREDAQVEIEAVAVIP
jgi:enamine deaminase RidA (YjgF/YER057c/UK114 family)